MRELAEKISPMYDYILIDTPPDRKPNLDDAVRYLRKYETVLETANSIIDKHMKNG